MNRRHAKTIAKPGLRIFAVVLALLCLFLTACAQKNDEEQKAAYESGVASYNAGDYAAAKSFFTEADGYLDSADYLTVIEGYENLYLDGVKALGDGDYRTAYSCFTGTGSYLNSHDYCAYIDSLNDQFEVGKLLYSQGQFLPARACFVAANGAGQSAEYIANIDSMVDLYNRAVDLMSAGSYMDAISAFRAINAEFEDSEQLIAECGERLKSSKVSLTGYIRNYNESYDGENRIDAGHLEQEFSMRDSKGVLFSGVTDEDGHITRVSFGFTAEVRESLGETGMTNALMHCIRALNPYIATERSVLDGMFAYLSRAGAGYGSMWIRSSESSTGSLLVEAQIYIGN